LLRILFVDDALPWIDIALALPDEKEDIHVEAADSGEAALELLERREFDVMVAYHHPPAVDGIHLLRKVRAAGDQVFFIFLAGGESQQVIIDALNSGADYYLPRVGEPRELFCAVMALARQSVLQRTAGHSGEDIKEGPMAGSDCSIIRALGHESSERFYREMVENFPKGAVILFDRDLRIFLTEGSGWHDVGMEPADILDRTIGELVALEEKEHLEGVARQVLEGASLSEVLRFAGRSYLARVEPLRSRSKEILAGMIITQEMTELTNAQDEMRNKDLFLTKVLGTTPDMIFVYEIKDGRILFSNRRVTEFLGYTAEQIKGSSSKVLEQVLHPDDLSAMAEHYGKLAKAKEGEILEVTYRMRKADGNYRWLHSRDSPFEHGPDGTAVSIIGVAEDITSRKEMELKLTESEAQFRRFFETADDSMLMIDMDGMIVDANASARARLNYTREELIGKRAEEIDRAYDQNLYIKRISGENAPRIFRGLHVRKDGSTYPVEVTLGSFESKGNRMTMAIARDISERVSAEEAINRANHKIEVLSSLNRHDVLNRMTVIGGYLELARDSAKERRSKQYIVKAMAAAEEVARQVKLSADYQLIGSRVPEWLSLRMMAKTATRNIEPTQVSVTENLGDFEIFADPMMESVFRNLVENAIKHGVKTRTITFKAEPVDDGLAIHVMDDGIGIPEVLKEKLFEYVLQSRKGHGLHFVRELLGITGMTINEVGKEGSGADFVILVPQGRFRRFEPS